MRVNVKRGDVVFTCTTEEQLQSFIEDGYEEIKQPEAEAPKAAAPRKPKQSK